MRVGFVTKRGFGCPGAGAIMIARIIIIAGIIIIARIAIARVAL
ncbi:MAG: hypothetical protein ABI759_24790 [Candidatus Solibacter sp.]